MGEVFVKRDSLIEGKTRRNRKRGKLGREEVDLIVYCPFTGDKSTRNVI